MAILRAVRRGGFTLVELLVVIGIIAMLASMLIPAVLTARRHVKAGVTKVEIRHLEVAFTNYFSDWGAYPPDRNTVETWDSLSAPQDSARCLVHYLGTMFRVSSGYSRNAGPYYDFPVDRVRDGRFIDALGADSRDATPAVGSWQVYFYRFDNNDAEGGDQTNWTNWNGPDQYTNYAGTYTNYNCNFSNVHPQGVDIWSAGWNSCDCVSTVHPTQGNLGDLGDDIGNW